jgi:hypothetical protein
MNRICSGTRRYIACEMSISAAAALRAYPRSPLQRAATNVRYIPLSCHCDSNCAGRGRHKGATQGEMSVLLRRVPAVLSLTSFACMPVSKPDTTARSVHSCRRVKMQPRRARCSAMRFVSRVVYPTYGCRRPPLASSR